MLKLILTIIGVIGWFMLGFLVGYFTAVLSSDKTQISGDNSTQIQAGSVNIDNKEVNNMMKFNPQADRVLLKEVEASQTDQGIILSSNTEKTKIYEVLAKGSDCSDGINIGDKVVCTKYIDGDFKYLSETLYLTKEINILAVIND